VIVKAPAGAADRSGGARLPDRLGLERLPQPAAPSAASRCPRDCSRRRQLPAPIFTPATKAPPGEHDENISFEAVEQLIGAPLAAAVRDSALALYRFAAEHARARGIIIADTKFEFGLDPQGRLTLIDEVLTPDSSRFWPADTWKPGSSPPSFDKQYVRDYLETLDWNKRPPGPHLPREIIERTSEKYREALRRLTRPLAHAHNAGPAPPPESLLARLQRLPDRLLFGPEAEQPGRRRRCCAAWRAIRTRCCAIWPAASSICTPSGWCTRACSPSSRCSPSASAFSRAFMPRACSSRWCMISSGRWAAPPTNSRRASWNSPIKSAADWSARSVWRC
jgi:hypothetical protein